MKNIFQKIILFSTLFSLPVIPLMAQTNINEKIVLDIYYDNNDPYAIYPVTKWESLLHNLATQHKLKDSQYSKLIFALGCVYHDQAKFKNALPLLENVYQFENKSSKIYEPYLLIKLEEEYRGLGMFAKAIDIRKERIKKKYINTYWEIYRDCELFEAAKRDFQNFQTLSPIHTKKRLLQNLLLGDIYFQNKEYDSAIIVFNNAITEVKEFIQYNKINNTIATKDLTYYRGAYIGYIGICNLMNGNTAVAIPMLLDDIHASGDNIGNKGSKMIYLADAYLQTGELNKVEKYLDSASILLKDKDYKRFNAHLFKSYANLYIAKNMHQKAVDCLKKYNKYNEEITHTIQENQSILLLAHLELDNRRKELLITNSNLIKTQNEVHIKNITIFLLVFLSITSIILSIFLFRAFRKNAKSVTTIEKKNFELKEKEQALKDEVVKNKLLLKEVHHRVKNNLQVITSLMNLRKRRQSDDATIQLLNSIQNRIQTMALVHENLHKTGNVEMVNTSIYIGNLVNYLLSTFQMEQHPIDIQLTIDKDILLPSEDVILIGLVINEAVSNAIKYAFKDIQNGIIKILMVRSNESIHLQVSDNGNGLDETQFNEKSLGFKLIKYMAIQLKGEYELINQNGVTHIINFTENGK